MAKTRDAGAAIVVEEARVRTPLERGVVGVRRPSEGGQVEGAEVIVVVGREVDVEVAVQDTCCRVSWVIPSRMTKGVEWEGEQVFRVS
jgi:hypothetical protein